MDSQSFRECDSERRSLTSKFAMWMKGLGPNVVMEVGSEPFWKVVLEKKWF